VSSACWLAAGDASAAGPGVLGRRLAGFQPALEHRAQVGERNRLGQKVVHAGRLGPPCLVAQRVCGEGDDRKVARATFQLADAGRELVAVEVRHVQIGQQERKVIRAPARQRLRTVAEDLGGVTEECELLLDDQPIDLVVLGDEDGALLGVRPPDCQRGALSTKDVRPGCRFAR